MNTLHDIYEAYAPEIYRFALGLCGDPFWADDITSETFFRALVSAKPIREATVKGYLFTIAHNLYLEGLRKDKRVVFLSDQVATLEASPERQSELNDEMRQMLHALQTLNEQERVALLMRVQGGLSYTAVSQALNISLSTAKVRVHRARQKLTNRLKELTA